MVKGADGKYTWKYEGYVATGAVEVEFKVVKDHDWDNGSACKQLLFSHWL